MIRCLTWAFVFFRHGLALKQEPHYRHLMSTEELIQKNMVIELGELLFNKKNPRDFCVHIIFRVKSLGEHLNHL